MSRSAANTPHRVLDLNQVYDPATNTWQPRQTMPTPRNHMFVGAVNGKIYVIGGRVGSMAVATGSTTDLVEEYDIAADRWGAVKLRMPTPRDGGVVGVYQNRIFVAGGQSITAINNSVSRALEAYDPATNTWTVVPEPAAGAAWAGRRRHRQPLPHRQRPHHRGVQRRRAAQCHVARRLRVRRPADRSNQRRVVPAYSTRVSLMTAPAGRCVSTRLLPAIVYCTGCPDLRWRTRSLPPLPSSPACSRTPRTCRS